MLSEPESVVVQHKHNTTEQLSRRSSNDAGPSVLHVFNIATSTTTTTVMMMMMLTMMLRPTTATSTTPKTPSVLYILSREGLVKRMSVCLDICTWNRACVYVLNAILTDNIHACM